MLLYRVILKVRLVEMKLIELLLNHSFFSGNSALEEGKEINSCLEFLYGLFVCYIYIQYVYLCTSI